MPIASPVLLAFLLHGCTPSEVDDPPGDDGETGAPGLWRPSSAEDVADAYLASQFNDIVPGTLFQAAQGAAGESGCPALAETDTSVHLSADGCSYPEYATWSGEAALTWSDRGGNREYRYEFIAFELRYEQDSGPTRYALDGVSTFGNGDSPYDREHALDYEEEGSYDGDSYAIAGYWTRSVDDSGDLQEIRSEVALRASAEGVVGALSLDETLDWSNNDCVDEPDGTSTLTGESVGVLEWDTRRCDGCAEVTLDSDDEGTVCW